MDLLLWWYGQITLLKPKDWKEETVWVATISLEQWALLVENHKEKLKKSNLTVFSVKDIIVLSVFMKIICMGYYKGELLILVLFMFFSITKIILVVTVLGVCSPSRAPLFFIIFFVMTWPVPLMGKVVFQTPPEVYTTILTYFLHLSSQSKTKALSNKSALTYEYYSASDLGGIYICR